MQRHAPAAGGPRRAAGLVGRRPRAAGGAKAPKGKGRVRSATSRRRKRASAKAFLDEQQELLSMLQKAKGTKFAVDGNDGDAKRRRSGGKTPKQGSTASGAAVPSSAPMSPMPEGVKRQPSMSIEEQRKKIAEVFRASLASGLGEIVAAATGAERLRALQQREP